MTWPGFARRIGICFVDYETFWWRADEGEPCPVCSRDDEGYEESHRFFVAEVAPSNTASADLPPCADCGGVEAHREGCRWNG